MKLDQYPRGVLVPVLTPFQRDLAVDAERFVEHCRWLLAEGANGLAVFGTTSEANSLSIAERMSLLERLIEHGVPAGVLMPGTGCCALPDTVALTRHAVERNCFGVLMLPPFYYKGVSDDGIHASIAEVVQRVADDRLRIYLYHIPPMAGVAFSLPLIERLLKDFPRIVVGIKDSSGDWNNTQALLDSFPGFEVFPGSETHLLDALRKGGAGCISATANVNVAAISRVIREWQGADADALQDGIARTRGAIQKFPMVAANKAILARVRDDPAWDVVRPPLRPLAAEAKAQLFQALEALQFDFGRRVATV
ncbi:MAG TPA: dihydrodipicolinate synthase family protein [Casimicrobiaceae bacterium]|jgi:4-hydroxy-tetrahydrodipicolinate synthase|nr:dihydrodipicolinate synthase family protein [Casimicrobiaceae bacterium]